MRVYRLKKEHMRDCPDCGCVYRTVFPHSSKCEGCIDDKCQKKSMKTREEKRVRVVKETNLMMEKKKKDGGVLA